MLSLITRREIALQFGKELRYPTDCEALSGHIYMVTKERISASTLKRMMGFVKGTLEPRLYSLDVIAHYLGFENWDKYAEKFTHTENSEFLHIEHLDSLTLDAGDTVIFTYEPERQLTLICKDALMFEVADSLNSKLKKGDLLKIFIFIKDYPLIIPSVIRAGVEMGPYKAGKISGITSIKLIKKDE